MTSFSVAVGVNLSTGPRCGTRIEAQAVAYLWRSECQFLLSVLESAYSSFWQSH